MSELAIRIDGISKLYQLGDAERYKALRDTLSDMIAAPFRALRRGSLRAPRQTLWALRDISDEIQEGEVVGLIGRNGAGKSTLLKMIVGADQPDAGSVRLGASLKVGYFAQQALDLLDPTITVFEQIQKDFPADSQGVLKNLLGAFQFSGTDVDKPIRVLSGGEKSRLVLARMLFDPPNFLVLDEPTNHLDLETKEMLVDSLHDFEGTMIFVSHDRTFLRGLSNRVLELRPGDADAGIAAQPPFPYLGSYVEYVERTGSEAAGVHN